MHNDIETRDSFVTQLFAKQDSALPANNFLPQLLARVERAQRARRLTAIAVLLVTMGVVALLSPWIAPMLSAFDALWAAAISTVDMLTGKPISWLLTAAILMACLPVLYVWRLWRP